MIALKSSWQGTASSKSRWEANAMSPDVSQGLGTAACDNAGYLGISILPVVKWYELPGVLAPQLCCQGRTWVLPKGPLVVSV